MLSLSLSLALSLFIDFDFILQSEILFNSYFLLQKSLFYLLHSIDAQQNNSLEFEIF